VRHRLHVLVFATVCALGTVTAVALAAAEAVRTPAVVVTVAHKTRQGDVTVLDVSVHNTTAVARCAVVRVAARDRGGHDLAATTAAASISVPPHARRAVAARITLTRRQYAEQLYAFVPSQHPCPDGRDDR